MTLLSEKKNFSYSGKGGRAAQITRGYYTTVGLCLVDPCPVGAIRKWELSRNPGNKKECIQFF